MDKIKIRINESVDGCSVEVYDLVTGRGYVSKWRAEGKTPEEALRKIFYLPYIPVTKMNAGDTIKDNNGNWYTIDQLDRVCDGTYPPRSVIDKAKAIVDGARQKDYGPPEENHARTAALWSAYLGRPITAEQVCDLNILQKLSRLAHSPDHEDSQVDIVGWMMNREACAKATTITEDAIKAQADRAFAKFMSKDPLSHVEAYKIISETMEGLSPGKGAPTIFSDMLTVEEQEDMGGDFKHEER